MIDEAAEADTREPGYCIVCGDFHLITPVPGRPGGVCGNCEQAGRLDLPPPPDQPRYARRISWRQQRRLQRTAAEFWSYGGDGKHAGELFTGPGRRRYLLRYFLRGRRS